MEAWNPSHWTANQFQSPHFLIHGFSFYYGIKKSFSGGASNKELPINAGEVGDAGSIPGSGRSPGEVNGYPLQDSCLENPMDRGAW